MGSTTFRANLGTGAFGVLLLVISFAVGQLLLGLIAVAMIVLSGFLITRRDDYNVEWWHAALRGISVCIGILFVFILAAGTAIGLGSGSSD